MKRTTTQAKVRAIKPKAAETRQIEFVISDESKDRHNTVIPASAWDLRAYRSNPVVFYQHEGYGNDLFRAADPDTLIGRAIEVGFFGKELRATVEFEPADINPLAEKVFRKLLFGSLKAASVGFIETAPGSYGSGDEAKHGENETYYFKRVELLEFSVVNIPSNRKAGKRLSELAPAVRSYASKVLPPLKPAKISNFTVEDIEILLQGFDLGFTNCMDPVKMRQKIWAHERKLYKKYIDQVAKDKKEREQGAWHERRAAYLAEQDPEAVELRRLRGTAKEETSGRNQGAANPGYLYD